MASLHLPLFSDGRLVSTYRNKPHIDGSFLSRPMNYFPEAHGDSLIVLDFQNDPLFAKRKKGFVKLTSEEGILSLVDRGKEYVEIMNEQGAFDRLPRV